MYADKLFVGLNSEAFVNGAELYRFAVHEAKSTGTETWHKVQKELDG